MKCFAVITGALVLGACGQSDDCQDTYAYGASGNEYSTTCDTAGEPPVGAQPLAIGECIETFATECPPGEERCIEVYERTCEGGVGNVSETEVGQLSQAVLAFPECEIDDGEHTVATLRPLAGGYVDALRFINADFSSDNDDVVFSLRGVTSRGAQATCNVTSHDVLDTDPANPDRAGFSQCRREPDGLRKQCGLSVYRGTIQGLAADIGADPFEMEAVTAMHEFGHSFCLDHYVDSSGTLSSLSAMNSFHLVDGSSGQLDYARFLATERDEVRSILRNP